MLLLPTPSHRGFFSLHSIATSFALSALAIASYGQQDNIITIEHSENWCSGTKTHSTKISEKPLKSSCAEKELIHNQWFRFRAATRHVEIRLNTGAEEGTMRFPYLSLTDDKEKELTCQRFSDEYNDIVIFYNNLTVGSWYHVAVANHNHSQYIGNFTLCITNKVSYDFKEGAVELKSLKKWCSEDAAYSTANATADERKPGCLKSGPNYNRWFKFKASSSSIKAEIKYGGDKGNCSFPYLALWDKNMSELKCSEYKDESTPILVSHDRLTPGEWYYLSVDHQYNIRYTGSFTLCLDDSKEGNYADLVRIIGKLIDESGRPSSGSRLLLLDEKGDTLSSAIANDKGKFEFEELPPEKKYFVKIEEKDADDNINMFFINQKGSIIKKTESVTGTEFRFEELPPDCNYMAVLDCDKVELTTKVETVGITGKVVNLADPREDISDLNVYLIIAPKTVIDSTITDKTGMFRFLNLNEGDEHFVKLGQHEKELYAEIIKFNSEGKIIMTSNNSFKDDRGYYNFQELPYILNTMKKIKAEDKGAISLATDFSGIEKGKLIQLSNIYFQYDQHSLMPTSHKELDRLVKILNERPELRIEIIGHTDNSGSDEYNEDLSQRRARAVMEYIISKDVERSRLSSKGEGRSRPVADNRTEEGREKNRRVEIRIL